MKKKITIIHPSMGRTKLAIETAMGWVNKSHYDFEYILVLSGGDKYLPEYLTAFALLNKELALRSKQILVHIMDGLPTMIKKGNEGVKLATGDIFLMLSDDVDCPDSWDNELLTALEGKQDYMVKVKDGIQDFLITMPIFDRAYYNRFGYVWNPIYHHLYADNELSGVAHRLNKIIYLDLLFEHKHYSVGKAAKDATNEFNEKFMGKDMETFAAREKVNFGLQ